MKISSSTMKLTISALVLCAAVRDSECRVGKCCPYGQVLSIFDDFICSFVEGEGERVIHQLKYHESRAGFRCPVGENVAIAALEKIVDRPIRWRSACIDIMYNRTGRIGTHVIFQCGPEGSSEAAGATGSADLPILPILRSCCGTGQSFDLLNGTCESDEKLAKRQREREKYWGIPDRKKESLLCREDGADAAATGSLAGSNFLTLRICCSLDKVYSVEKRDCVAKTGRRNVPKYLDFLNERFQFITVVRGAPACEHALLDHVVDVTRDLRVRDDGEVEVFLDTTNGRETMIVNEKNACLDLGDSSASDLVVFRVCSDSRFCKEHPCVRKCCPDDEASVWSICDRVPKNSLPGRFHDALLNESIARGLAGQTGALDNSDYGLLIGIPCQEVAKMQDTWRVSPQGYVYLSNGKVYRHDEYCLEMSYPHAPETSHISLRVCVESLNEYINRILIIHGVFETASCAFLIVTLLVYIFRPVLRNLRGKILMCHMASLVLGYACYAIITLVSVPTEICPSLGYATFFSWISAFSWLNVLCFDMWRTLSGKIGVATSEGRGDAHNKRFLLYSLYAWGYSFLALLLCIAVDTAEFVPRNLRPNIGIDSCWFIRRASDSYKLLYGEMIFFIIPISLQLVANVIFFTLTARHCSLVKAQITELTDSPAEPRIQRFHAARKELTISIKLFMVMGLTFIFVLIFTGLFYYDAGLYWHIGFMFAQDVVNCLHGLTIFCLFVINDKVYKGLLKGIGRETIRKTVPADAGAIRARLEVPSLVPTAASL